MQEDSCFDNMAMCEQSTYQQLTSNNFYVRILDFLVHSLWSVLGPDFGPKSPDFDFLRKTGLFRTGLSPDSIPNQVRYPGNF